ncbi:MAG: pirin family protein [Alphaproteobacteria bacterium]
MGDVVQLLAPKVGDIGNFEVRRALPSARRRMVGPFIFWDEMGPAHFAPGQGLDVRPHPHIGLATVTYLFDGALEHRDTMGVHATIRPGDVNIMAAGSGVVHSERTGADVRAAGHCLHGIQAWIALPEDQQEIDPVFDHQDQADLPAFDRDGARVTLIAGTAYGRTAPTRVFSPTLYLDVSLPAGAHLMLPDEHEERAIYVVDGSVRIDGHVVPARSMGVIPAEAAARMDADQTARVMVLGGAPLGPRHIVWNFVSTDPERVARARDDWRASIAGGWRDTVFRLPDTEQDFIPFPGDSEGPPESTDDCPTS